MGAGSIAPVQANIMRLALYKSQLENSISNICNKRMNLAWQTNALTQSNDNDPRLAQLASMDSYLELQQKALETQQKSAAALLESMEKLLDNNISKVFKLNLSA